MPLGKEVGLGPGHIVLDGDPVGTQPPQQPLPTLRPMSIVAKRSPISATAELLSYNLNEHQPIILIFGRNVIEKRSNQKMLHLTTSRN